MERAELGEQVGVEDVVVLARGAGRRGAEGALEDGLHEGRDGLLEQRVLGLQAVGEEELLRRDRLALHRFEDLARGGALVPDDEDAVAVQGVGGVDERGELHRVGELGVVVVTNQVDIVDAERRLDDLGQALAVGVVDVDDRDPLDGLVLRDDILREHLALDLVARAGAPESP